MSQTFIDLFLPAELIAALGSQKITIPTPIQSAAIPVLKEKKSAYLLAETGTGKTLAYLLPIFASANPKVPNVQAVVLAPTHELAIQIHRQCLDLAQQSGIALGAALLIGGASMDRQIEKLKKKPQIVVGSPGRIRELTETRKLKLHLVRTIVLDEADRLLVPEKISDIQALVKTALKDTQLVFVSATEPPFLQSALHALSPDVVKVNASNSPVSSTIEHFYLRCAERDKPEIVRKLIHALKPDRSLIFVHKNDDAELVAHKLAYHQMSVIDIHGALDKEDRKNAMDKIRSGKASILIASDVAARGLDIKGLTHVFNLDIPSDSKNYLHRVGRTGRAGAAGVAISLISADQFHLMERFEKDLSISLKEISLREGTVFEVDDAALI